MYSLTRLDKSGLDFRPKRNVARREVSSVGSREVWKRVGSDWGVMFCWRKLHLSSRVTRDSHVLVNIKRDIIGFVRGRPF